VTKIGQILVMSNQEVSNATSSEGASRPQMAGKEKEKKEQDKADPTPPVDPDEFDDLDDLPRHHARVDPDERAEYEEWRKERQGRGRKKRRREEEHRRYRQDEELF
jgi:hypothetical protein